MDDFLDFAGKIMVPIFIIFVMLVIMIAPLAGVFAKTDYYTIKHYASEYTTPVFIVVEVRKLGEDRVLGRFTSPDEALSFYNKFMESLRPGAPSDPARIK